VKAVEVAGDMPPQRGLIVQRQQLADALARCMTQLGLERKTREVRDLKAYLAEHESDDKK
jgi:hypothetical protein